MLSLLETRQPILHLPQPSTTTPNSTRLDLRGISYLPLDLAGSSVKIVAPGDYLTLTIGAAHSCPARGCRRGARFFKPAGIAARRSVSREGKREADRPYHQ